MNTLFFVILPYVAIVSFVGGHLWRYRYDRFGWTTRSSQLYESRLLRLGSPLFHFGILLVALGHIGGLLIPESWTSAVGISEDQYHAVAFTVGTIAGLMTVVGLISAPVRDLLGLIDARIEQLKEQGDTGEAPAAEAEAPEGQTPEASVPAETAEEPETTEEPAASEEPVAAESETEEPVAEASADTAPATDEAATEQPSKEE